MSRAFQSRHGLIDSSGHCLFIAFAILDIASGVLPNLYPQQLGNAIRIYVPSNL
jgi:hypothetical protein